MMCIKTIYNFVDQGDILRKSNMYSELTLDKSLFNMITMGRLSPQKNYDFMLDSINKLSIIYNFNFKLYRELFLNRQYNSVGDYFYLFEYQKNLIEKYVFSFFNLEPIPNQDKLILPSTKGVL